MRRQIGACGTVACLLFLPLPAVAQQDAQAEDEAPPQFTDEITVRVTARARGKPPVGALLRGRAGRRSCGPVAPRALKTCR